MLKEILCNNMLGVLGFIMLEEILLFKIGFDYNKIFLFSGEKKFGFDVIVVIKIVFCYN